MNYSQSTEATGIGGTCYFNKVPPITTTIKGRWSAILDMTDLMSHALR